MDSDSGQFKAALDHRIGTLAGEGGAPDARALSPTLCLLEAARRPDPMPVCGGCPRSMWFLSKETGLKAYCRAMHAIVWESDNPQPILACDRILDVEEVASDGRVSVRAPTRSNSAQR